MAVRAAGVASGGHDTRAGRAALSAFPRTGKGGPGITRPSRIINCMDLGYSLQVPYLPSGHAFHFSDMGSGWPIKHDQVA